MQQNGTDGDEAIQQQLDFIMGHAAGLQAAIFLIIEAIDMEVRAQILTDLRRVPPPDVGTPPYADGYASAIKAIDARANEAGDT